MSVLKKYDNILQQWVPIVAGGEGPAGPQGPVGPAGPQGPQGPTDAQSIAGYDILIDNLSPFDIMQFNTDSVWVNTSILDGGNF